MKRFIAKGITVILLVAALAFPLATPAFAASPGTQGQPGQVARRSPRLQVNQPTIVDHHLPVGKLTQSTQVIRELHRL